MSENTLVLPDSLSKFVNNDQPRELRLSAAKGMIPAPPGDLVLVLYALTRDDDAEIADNAAISLNEIPVEVLLTVLSNKNTNPGVLDYFARKSGDDKVVETIVLNSSTSDSTISFLAETSSNHTVHELIAGSHERIVRSESIAEAFSRNPVVSRSTLDSVIDYIKLSLGESSGPPDNMTGTGRSGHDPGQVSETVQADQFLGGVDIDDELIVDEDESEEDKDRADKKRQYIQHKIAHMAVAEKIRLSIMGNRDARMILVRDPNRIVSRAVLKNPRLTESEILLISQSKIVNEEILREIADNRKWAKLYQVKLSLVNNPKTPPHVSMSLMRQLRDSDVKSLAWNRNLPGAVSSAARRVVEERKLKH